MTKKTGIGITAFAMIYATNLCCMSHKPCKAGTADCVCRPGGDCDRGRCVDNRCVGSIDGETSKDASVVDGDNAVEAVDGRSSAADGDSVDVGGNDDAGTEGTNRTTCEEMNCSTLATCIYQPQGYICQCPLGYLGDGRGKAGCEDVDECATDNGGCDSLSACVNTEGSHTCGPCPVYFNGDGYTGCKSSWTIQFGTDGRNDGRGVTTDDNGNVYVTGVTQGDLFDEINSVGDDVFVVSYDAAGIRRWAHQIGTGGFESSPDVATDHDGNVYVTCSIYSDMDGYINVGGNDLIIIKYDSDGAKEWTRYFGTEENENRFRIATDSDGNIYLAGEIQQPYKESDPLLDSDLVVLKYDSEGVHQWTSSFATDESESSYGIAVDRDGNVYVAGYAYRIPENETVTTKQVIIIKYNDEGVEQWTRFVYEGYDVSIEAHDIAADSEGNIYLTGLVSGDLDGSNTGRADDIFVIKFDSNGTRQWVFQHGSSQDEEGIDITTDDRDNVYVTGDTRGSMDHSSAGDVDTFVFKLDNMGVHQWTRQFGTSGEDSGNGVTVDNNGNIYVTGSTGGSLDGNPTRGTTDVYIVKYDGEGNRF